MQNRHLAEWRFCFLTLIVTVYPRICIVSVIGIVSPRRHKLHIDSLPRKRESSLIPLRLLSNAKPKALRLKRKNNIAGQSCLGYKAR